MKKILFLVLFVISGCSYQNGVATGKLIDVWKDGWIFKSCEITLQYGELSSKIVGASSLDLSMCDDMEALVGKQIVIKYYVRNLSFVTNSNNIIESVK